MCVYMCVYLSVYISIAIYLLSIYLYGEIDRRIKTKGPLGTDYVIHYNTGKMTTSISRVYKCI